MGQKHGVDSRGKCGEVCGCWKIHTKQKNNKSVTYSSSPFDDLPEDCFSNIISFMTPRDVHVAAKASKEFRLRFNSDSVWEKFIPPDYASLIPKSRVFSSKKELYVALCDPFLIEHGKKSVVRLDSTSGMKCVMLSPELLWIKEGKKNFYWKWILFRESRFERVPELQRTHEFKIYVVLNTRIISPRTHYSAYIVYKKTNHCYGFENYIIEAEVGFKGHEMPKTFVRFDSKRRRDGWMEAKIGDFFNEGGLMGFDQIVVNIEDFARQPHRKSGLIIEGIEFRPEAG